MSSASERRAVVVLVATSAIALASCGGRATRYNDGGDLANAAPPPLPLPRGAAAVPEGPYPGIAISAIEANTSNPYNGDTSAVERGRQLFVGMNCSGCHGFEAKAGLMAPNLVDNYWRYGGSDADVFNSIYEGRARGMPAWGAVLSTNQIWELVSYVRSLGGMTGPRVPGALDENAQKAQTPAPQNKRQP